MTRTGAKVAQQIDAVTPSIPQRLSEVREGLEVIRLANFAREPKHSAGSPLIAIALALAAGIGVVTALRCRHWSASLSKFAKG
jgi:hypothetical protein